MVREVQFLKLPGKMCARMGERVIFSREVHPLKAFSPIVYKPSPVSTYLRFMQSSKAESLIEATESGRMIDVRDVQPMKVR